MCELDATLVRTAADGAVQQVFKELRCLAHGAVLMNQLNSTDANAWSVASVEMFRTRVSQANVVANQPPSACLQLLLGCSAQLAALLQQAEGAAGGAGHRTGQVGGSAKLIAALQALVADAVPPVPIFPVTATVASATLLYVKCLFPFSCCQPFSLRLWCWCWWYWCWGSQW